ncbi:MULTISPECIES: rRNA maturation RNase YbeY [Gracilibacillus]|uniref:Endoribonuclease YbeY n=1 Tax=Gracilibacillus dipsosauri TaxID=178340 RepID=A0A317KZ31_9BACI|nr:rRNA maturation RNase YbeY [Gracilibacillus dipsosauri]PWU68486.1 rRNA maturation RNase YbeY [Gracilibacillus dipsosauri]
MEIDFIDETESIKQDYLELISRLLSYAATEEKIPDNAELSLTFVDNEEIQRLNKEYRSLDRPTDVLSFALEEEQEGELAINGEGLPLVLGDIIISVTKAEEQAKEYNHSLSRELGFLALHGFLHLLGYDHMEKDEETKMFSRQEEILNGFGLSR